MGADDDDEGLSKATKEETPDDNCTPTMLHRLPPPLLTLVLQQLPFLDKLTQLTHLHSLFPLLQPAHFSFDCISTTSALRTACHSSPRLQQLLSAARAVIFQDLHVVHRPDSADELGWSLPRHGIRGNNLETTPQTLSPHSFAMAQQMALTIQCTRSVAI